MGYKLDGFKGTNGLGPNSPSETISVVKSQEFLEIVTIKGHSTTVCNGFVRKIEYPALSASPSTDELVSHIAYFEKIIMAMRHTKSLKASFDHNHKVAKVVKDKAELVKPFPTLVAKHAFSNAFLDLPCKICGLKEDSDCHHNLEG